jgi:hypothetical protein
VQHDTACKSEKTVVIIYHHIKKAAAPGKPGAAAFCIERQQQTKQRTSIPLSTQWQRNAQNKST